MLSVAIITLFTFLTLIFLSFEIQSCWRVLSELISITSGIKLADSFISFRWVFSLSGCLVLFGGQSSQVYFHTIFTKIHMLMEKTSNVLKYFWTMERYPHLWDEYRLSINDSYQYFRYIWKQNRNSYKTSLRNIYVFCNLV